MIPKNKRFSKIAESLEVDEDSVRSVAQIISELNPCPEDLLPQVIPITSFLIFLWLILVENLLCKLMMMAFLS